MSLFEVAAAAMQHAYAPYSGFRVGAAVRSADGRVFGGCNVENAAYPQGTCAEAGAIAAMIASGARDIVEVLVVADGDLTVTPCGGCRQKLSEFSGDDTVIIMAGPEGERARTTMAGLLPGRFTRTHLDEAGHD